MSRDGIPFDEIARWRAPDARDGAAQMALDETMLRLATLPVLRVYRWNRSEVTFGYPQAWEEAHKFASGRAITRRCTGGGFVEHGADTTIAIAVPAAHAFVRLPPAETYRRIHEAIRAALFAEDLRLAGQSDCSSGLACFASPAPFDLLRDDLKIAGGAQRRSRDGFLYQGSVQNLAVDGGFGDRLAAALAPAVTDWQPPAGWADLRDELVAARYGSDAWNRRR